jgi:glycerol-3-phosphate dehydrogenase
MARTVDDVLARRTRALSLNAAAAKAMAPAVARILGDELGRDHDWQARQLAEFENIVPNYLVKEPIRDRSVSGLGAHPQSTNTC